MDEKAEEYKEKVKENMREERVKAEKKAGQYAERGKTIVDKFSNDIDKSIDDLKISVKDMQKTIDNRIQDYRETRIEKINIDLIETEEKYYLKINLAGIEKENIDIETSERKIVISAILPPTIDEIVEENAEYLINELKTGTIKRTIQLPEKIKFKEVTATSKLGIINLDIPKEITEKYNVDLN